MTNDNLINIVKRSFLLQTGLFLLIFFSSINNYAFALDPIGIKGAANTVARVINDGIKALDNQSYNWQKVLEITRDRLIKEGQTTLSNEVSNVLSRATQSVGIEARCYTDFLRDRVREDLIRIRAILTREKIYRKPYFCMPQPSTINYDWVKQGRLNALEIDGYNLDARNIRVYLLERSKKGYRKINISHALSFTTHYLITLNLGKNGVKLTRSSEKILFRMPNKTKTVNIIRPHHELVKRFVPEAKMYLCPKKIGGDREFGGNGPKVTVKAKLFKKRNALWVALLLHAKETSPDWSEARGIWRFPIQSPPIGYKIVGFSPSAPSIGKYTDFNHQVDIPPIHGSALVRRFEVNGDTGDNDIGNCTRDDVYMNVYFNEVQVKYAKI